MKKYFIPALIGTIIFFMYQWMSWDILQIHNSAFKYTPQQDSIMASLNKANLKDAVYALPYFDMNSPTYKEDMAKCEKEMGTKPTAMIIYHSPAPMNMGKSMFFGFIIDFIMINLIILIINLGGDNINSFGKRYFITLSFGIFTIFQTQLTGWNWFNMPVHFWIGEVIDLIIGWSLIGVWLAWWMGRNK